VLLHGLRTSNADDDGVPPPFAEACFDDFDDRKPYPGMDDVGRLLAPVEHATFRPEMAMVSHRFRSNSTVAMCAFSGLFRLAETWQSDSVLRFSLLCEKRLRLHFWNGRRGVTLVYQHDHWRTWSGYGAHRETDGPLPDAMALWATDNERYRRLGSGTVEVRVQDGSLVLSRGEFPLLVVPFEGVPEEVFLEGSARVRGIVMTRTGPMPLPLVAARPVVVKSTNPAELCLSPALEPGSQLLRLPDGRLRLENRAKGAFVVARVLELPADLHEVILELDDFCAGTGISFGDGEGKELGRFAFYRAKEGRITYGPMANWAKTFDLTEEPDKRPARLAHERQWLRVVSAGGVLNFWTSGDGIHWSWPGSSSLGIAGPCRELSLMCFGGEEARSIAIRSIEVRRFDRLPSLVPTELVGRVPRLPMVESLAAWQTAVDAAQPPDVPADAWRRACILHTLERSMTKGVSQPLLAALVTEGIRDDRPIAEKIALMNEAVLLADYQEWTADNAFSECFHLLARQLIAEGDSAVFSHMQQAMVAWPYWRHVTLDLFRSEWINEELLDLTASEQWEAAAHFERRLSFYGAMHRLEQPAGPWGDATEHILRWTVDQLIKRGLREATAASMLPFRPPLVERIDKETFNALSEFDAALSAEAYRDACQLITNLGQSAASGVVPASRDDALWVSLPVAVELALRNTPPLRAAMESHVGELGSLRINQAVADGDAAAVRAATIQFRGTRPATEAQLWLGDRALSAGAFHEAVSHYRESLAYLDAAQQPGAAARLRLAAAMLGRDVGRAPSESVEVGGMRLSPADFERLVADARRTRKADVQRTTSATRCPPPGSFGLAPPVALQLGAPKRPQGVPETGTDWLGRQTGVSTNGSLLFTSNSQAIAAFDTASGTVRWTLGLDGNSGDSHAAEAMTPAFFGKLVVMRRVVGDIAELVGLLADTGGLVWTQRLAGTVVSEPCVVGQRLFALAAGGDSVGQSTLELVEFEPLTGRIVQTTPLIDIRDLAPRATGARLTSVNDNLLISVAGSVLCCDLRGQLRWRRQQPWIRSPSTEYAKAPDWFEQRHLPLLADESHVFVSQPGVFAVECLELATGRLVWRRSVPDIIAVLGRADGRIVVESRRGFVALDGENGRIVWRHESPRRYNAHLLGEPGGLAYVRADLPADEKSPWHATLVWLDLETGKQTGECDLGDVARGTSLGPFAATSNRWWLFMSKYDADRAAAEMAELQRRK
jgi:outer membrane protein assembly factor BamB